MRASQTKINRWMSVNPNVSRIFADRSGAEMVRHPNQSQRERDVERRLTDLGLEVYLPWMRARRRIGSRHQWVLVPLFPGYVFFRLDMVHVRKSRAILSRSQRFSQRSAARLPKSSEEIIKALRQRCPQGVAQIDPVKAKPGDTVRINEGPFSGSKRFSKEPERERKRGGAVGNPGPPNPHGTA